MISHEEIKNLVVEWNIREDIIEKDYVIGWVLWGIGQDTDLNHKWIFKCETKGISVPTIDDIRNSPSLDELKSEWSNMLEHQLPALPPFEESWGELPKLFDWLEEKYVPEKLKTVPVGKEEVEWRPPPVAWNWGIGLSLESVRFAAVNHLCVELEYMKEGIHFKRYLIEPYSLRRTKDDNLILHAIRVDIGEHRSYRVDWIQSIKVTTRPFKPVYQIEFPTTGTIYAPPSSRMGSSYGFSKKRKTHYDPTYIFECSICGKRFRKSKYDSTLRPHKDKNGWDCSGRVGMYVDAEYD